MRKKEKSGKMIMKKYRKAFVQYNIRLFTIPYNAKSQVILAKSLEKPCEKFFLNKVQVYSLQML